ncbi:MAG: type II secretion system F family protein [archaeon]
MKKFKVPYTFSSSEILRRKTKPYLRFVKARRGSFRNLEKYLRYSESDFNKQEFIALVIRSFVIFFLIFSTVFASILFLILKTRYFYYYGIGIAIIFSFFILLSQMMYPRIYSFKKIKDIEKNIIPSLQDIQVQLSSGVPMFQIISNIASSDYGQLSSEFKKAVKEISAGKPQIEVLDKIGNENVSVYFRRIVWQISNGMRSGSDMSMVIKDSIDHMTKEQAIQIQSYGSKLNPMVMFYLLIGVIVPALGLTFLTIIASMVGMESKMLKLMYIGILAIVTIIQIMFLGIIKSRRPSLL